ncbi:MAG: TonB-dependent receptor, partial [Bacteroidales bacterium]|nr:TonB-dependent receptor [Bacteroidales bacterium]
MRNSILLALFGLCPFAGVGQTATDVIPLTQSDLKGTARFMSMGGAFGALGGDLSTLSQNPAGIGVYRSSELGFTLDLDCQRSSATSQGF